MKEKNLVAADRLTIDTRTTLGLYVTIRVYTACRGTVCTICQAEGESILNSLRGAVEAERTLNALAGKADLNPRVRASY